MNPPGGVGYSFSYTASCASAAASENSLAVAGFGSVGWIDGDCTAASCATPSNIAEIDVLIPWGQPATFARFRNVPMPTPSARPSSENDCHFAASASALHVPSFVICQSEKPGSSP